MVCSARSVDAPRDGRVTARLVGPASTHYPEGLMLRTAPLLIGLLAALMLTSPLAEARPTTPEEEAKRQLEFGWKEIVGGGWHDALTSAESALRLYPGLYEAMVVKALAYEGLEDYRRAESWLQTYLELIGSARPHPEAVKLRARVLNAIALEEAAEPSDAEGSGEPAEPAEPTEPGKPTEPTEPADPDEPQLPTRTGQPEKAPADPPDEEDAGPIHAWGDVSIIVGGFGGYRLWSQSPCDAAGCEGVPSQLPGFVATSSAGGGAGLTVRAEYFVAGWWIAPQVRYDLISPPALAGLDVPLSHRLDLRVAGRIPLLRGSVRLWLLADVGYGMRTWSTLQVDTAGGAVGTDIASSQILAAVGARLEPIDRFGSVDAGFRDPAGNGWKMIQAAGGAQ